MCVCVCVCVCVVCVCVCVCMCVWLCVCVVYLCVWCICVCVCVCVCVRVFFFFGGGGGFLSSFPDGLSDSSRTPVLCDMLPMGTRKGHGHSILRPHNCQGLLYFCQRYDNDNDVTDSDNTIPRQYKVKNKLRFLTRCTDNNAQCSLVTRVRRPELPAVD